MAFALGFLFRHQLLAGSEEAVLRRAMNVGRRLAIARRGTTAMPGSDAAQESLEILLLLVGEAGAVFSHRQSAASSVASAAGAAPS